MQHTATLTLQFANPDEAGTVAAALEPDNEGHMSTRVEGNQLVLQAASETSLGLLRTLDDALGCIRALGYA